MLEKHLPMIHDAGKKGVQILCLQEIFNGPYFCPARTSAGTTPPSRCPGPTVEKLAPIAAKYEMAMVVPVYEREMAGVYYNTAAIIDADGTLPRQVPQEPHPADQRVLGEVLLQPGQPRLPGVQDPLRDDRRVHLLRPPLPRGRARARPRTAPRSSTTRRRRSPGSRSTCGSSSSPRTRSRTATSSARSTASAPRRRGTSASSTATRTSSNPRGQIVACGSRGQGRAGRRRRSTST